MRHLLLASALPFALLACTGADGEDVVINPDGAERVAELERAVADDNVQGRDLEVIGEGSDFTREGQDGDGVDRYDVPTDTPVVGTPKYDQVGATTCPETQHLSLGDYSSATAGIEGSFEEWLLDESAPEGTVRTESGLKYRVVQPGIERGYRPQKFDDVEVNYHGLLADGTVFDSSYERGDSISFKPAQVIPGWTEALTSMAPCEARTLYIPAELAYGERGSSGVIPPNTPLIFHVQMLGVEVL